MNTIKLLLAEIRYRKLNFFMSLFAVVTAAALFTAGPVLVDGYGRETHERIAAMEEETTAELDKLADQTRILMRDMGFNLMIVHKDTDMSDFWSSDFASEDLPQEYIDRLAGDSRLTLITHLVATLQKRIEWNGRKVLLVGYLPEATQSHMRKKSPMGFEVEPGTCFLGHELAAGRKKGQTIDVAGREFTIAQILPEQGSKQDITIAVHLTDAQAVLDLPGRINQIMALGCNCAGSDLANIRGQLATVLPETRITEFRSIALARAEQREEVKAKSKEILDQVKESREAVQGMMGGLFQVLTPVVVIACAIWIGLLSLANVRQRRMEIGLFRAIGKGSAMIASLFLGKAVLLGALGGLIGYFFGDWTARVLGVKAFEIGPGQFQLSGSLLAAVLVGAPLLSAVAAYLPALVAIHQDPAVVLRDQ